jgi:hypothetical protein
MLSACSPANEALTVQDAWARQALQGQNGAVYFVIQNDTRTDDALIGAGTDAAASAEAHMSMMDSSGVMSMRMQDAVQVPAGESVVFKPGELHVMLIDLNRDLQINDTFTLTLRFEKAGEITLQVEVKEP